MSIESKVVQENLNNLQKLKFTKLKSQEINSILINKNNKDKKNNNKEETISVNELKSLSIIESDFSSINLNKISTKELTKLKIKKTPLPLSLKYFFESILVKTSSLQKLYLQKCLLDDNSLSKVFDFLLENKHIYKSLIKMSFLGNEITSVIMDKLLENNCYFENLVYLDFSKNNIYEFLSDNFKLLNKLKVLDLSDNNIASFNFFTVIRKLKGIVLLSNNIFLNNNKNNANKYRKYLKEKLNSLEYKVNKLNFTLLYNKDSLNQLLELKISPMIQISLIKLNLSYCGLSEQIICEFLQNKNGLLNLEQLNLSNNLITIKLFKLISKKDISLEKLLSLDLSYNNISSLNIEEYSEIEQFIDKHSHLKKIKLHGSTFCQELLLLSQLEKERCESINQKLINKEVKFIVESKHNILIVPLKELFEIKDKNF